jgi:hypothetical protein
MNGRLARHIILGAIAAEVLALALYLLIASLFTIRVSSPLGIWWPLTFPALVGCIIGALAWLVRRRR